MNTRKKVLITIAVVVVGAAVVAANLYFRRDTGVEVTAEAIRSRDLQAIVSASGKVQPMRRVNISANRPGRVTRLAVQEGQRVAAGQFLLEIDPRSLEGQLQRGEAAERAGVRRDDRSETGKDAHHCRRPCGGLSEVQAAGLAIDLGTDPKAA